MARRSSQTTRASPFVKRHESKVRREADAAASESGKFFDVLRRWCWIANWRLIVQTILI